MTLLILGLVLWIGLHYMRTATPDLRQAMTDRLGSASKGLMALGIIVSVVLMVMGYRAAIPVQVWVPPFWLTYVNNVLMIFALYVYFMTAAKPGTAWVMGGIKNPQLTGFKIWTVAHLLVNGDLASIVLFGGLLGWAVGQVILSKRAPSLVDRDTAKIGNPFVHAGLVLVVFVVITGIHTWLGYNPFGGLT